MHKADLLDELRSEIGVVSDKYTSGLMGLYKFVCFILVSKIKAYKGVSIYLTDDTFFRCKYQQGSFSFPESVSYGEDYLSLAAVRGNIVREKKEKVTEVLVPFYEGHHLIGILRVISHVNEEIDEGDISLLCEIVSLFEAKLNDERDNF